MNEPMDTTGTRPSGRHPVNISHLVMGLAFAGILGVWGLVQTDTVSGGDVRWLLPIPWVVAGLAGLVAAAVTGTRRHAVRQTGWAGEPPYRTVGERLGDLRELKQLKHLGDRPAPPAPPAPDARPHPTDETPTDQTPTDETDEETKS